MKKSKLQIPNYKETPSTRHQSQTISRSRTWKPVLGAFLVLGCCLALPARAQFSIDWSTIDGGGGTSTGGVYQVSGTIGQPDAGTAMTGGNFSLTGGFWSLFSVVQTPGAPTVTIVRATPGNATISWSPNTPGYVLQETLSLSPANWTNSPSGSTNPITVPATLPGKYFRLSKP